jgi:ketosteroid isomerase-like protein
MRYTFVFAAMFLGACQSPCPKVEKVDKEAVKREIIAIEKEFATFLKDSGVAAAFYKFAAPDAVIKRGNGTDTLIKGRDAISQDYTGLVYERSKAEWKPDFVDVSDDGTMAYTYGKYNWTFRDSTGKESNYNGVFHTVWKKKSDGSWKYVWD